MKAGGGALPRTNPPTQKPPSPPMSGKGTLGYVNCASASVRVQADVRRQTGVCQRLSVCFVALVKKPRVLQMSLVAPSFIISPLPLFN